MRRFLVAVISVFVLFGSAQIYASGFFLYNQDAKAQGQAGAFTAQADNPSAIYYNPAGISQLDSTQISLGTRFIRLETEYESPLGYKEDLQAEWAVVPNAYITSDLCTEKWTVGLGVFAPFGLSTSWSGKGLLRYVTTDANFNMVDINPAVAYQLLPQLSIGLGVDYYNVYSYTSELKQNFLISDADVKLDVNGDGWGFNLGGLWKPHPKHSFGLAYRSKVDIKFGGDLKYKGIPPGLGYPPTISYNVKEDMTLPSVVSGGYAFRPTDKLKLEIDINWVEWSTIDKLDIKDKDTGDLLSSTDSNWDNTWILALGGEYLITEKIALRAGYSFQQNAVPEETFNPNVPDSDLHTIGLGLGFMLDRFTIDLAYSLGLYTKREINKWGGLTAVLPSADGKYDSLIHVIGISAGYKF